MDSSGRRTPTRDDVLPCHSPRTFLHLREALSRLCCWGISVVRLGLCRGCFCVCAPSMLSGTLGTCLLKLKMIYLCHAFAFSFSS